MLVLEVLKLITLNCNLPSTEYILITLNFWVTLTAMCASKIFECNTITQDYQFLILMSKA